VANVIVYRLTSKYNYKPWFIAVFEAHRSFNIDESDYYVNRSNANNIIVRRRGKRFLLAHFIENSNSAAIQNAHIAREFIVKLKSLSRNFNANGI
jgi:hypothetical protein